MAFDAPFPWRSFVGLLRLRNFGSDMAILRCSLGVWFVSMVLSVVSASALDDSTDGFFFGTGSFDDGSIKPFACTQSSVLLNPLPVLQTLEEGESFTSEISLEIGADRTSTVLVNLIVGTGLRVNQSSFLLNEANGFTGKFVMRGYPFTELKVKQCMTLTIQWGYVEHPDCFQSTQLVRLMLKRRIASIGMVYGAGHIRSLDGLQFDFYETGVFQLAQARNLEVQVYTRRSTGSQSTFVAGLSVAFGNSVLRFFIENQRLVLAKGTSLLPALSVEKSTTQSDSYRVFISADPASYLDVKLSYCGYDVCLTSIDVLSAYFTRDVHGILGNANGNTLDDVKESAKLGQLSRVSSLNNLFTCTNECSGLVQPPTDADLIQMDPNRYSHQGFTPLTTTIPLRTTAPTTSQLRG